LISTGTYQPGAGSRRPLEIAKKIQHLEPDYHPLITLLLKLATEPTGDIIFYCHEKGVRNRWAVVNDVTEIANNKIVVNSGQGAYFRPGDNVKDVTAGLTFVVDAVNPDGDNADELKVYQSGATALSGNVAADDVLLIMGPSYAQGADVGEPINVGETPVVNYCQDFRTPLSITDVMRKTKMIGPDELAEQRREKLFEHMKGIELQYWFGEGKLYSDTPMGSDTTPRAFTRGVHKFLSKNVLSSVGTLTEPTFEAWLRDVTRYGDIKDKVLFLSPLIMSGVNTWGLGKLQMVPDNKTYGITVMKYRFSRGEINLVEHKLFEDPPDSVSAAVAYSGYGFCVDIAHLKNRVFSETALLEDRQLPGQTKKTDEYETISGLELNNEEMHGVIEGVTGVS